MSAETETPNPAQAPEGKYVYCIIETTEQRSFGPIGIGGRGDEVYTVHHDGLAAVVSNARMQLGRLIETAMTERSDAYVREIYSGLRDTAVASRANKPIGDKMIMNAAFLIERDREQEFDSKVKEIAARYEGKLSFKYTGPWPPYNFVHIRLKLERGEGAA